MAGFCYGVKRAVDLSKEIKQNNPNKKIYILGELIHNAQAIKDLEELGIQTVDEIPADKNGICIIRTHGEAPAVIEEIKKAGCEVVDATCPDVKKVQNKASELAQKDFQVVIVGKSEHPEVIAIKGHADAENKKEAIVVSCASEIQSQRDKLKENVGVVVQTTQKRELLEEITAEIVKYAKEMVVCNTICPATKNRQKEALKIADEADMMVVVGGKNSANTTHLAQILNTFIETIHIETEDELEQYQDLIEKSQNIGVTAGASTPEETIEKIIKRIGEN